MRLLPTVTLSTSAALHLLMVKAQAGSQPSTPSQPMGRLSNLLHLRLLQPEPLGCTFVLVSGTEPRRVRRRLQPSQGGAITTRTSPYSPEVCERAVRMGLAYQGKHDLRHGAICSIAAKIGCAGATLRETVRQAEPEQDLRTEYGRAPEDPSARTREPRAAPSRRNPAQGRRLCS